MTPAESAVDVESSARRLVELGFAPNEARCYLSLLVAGPATAAEVARDAGVPRPKVYGALQALERRGFCAVSGEERVAQYRAVTPELALSEWLTRREQQRRAEAERDEELGAELIRALPEVREAPPAGAAFMEVLAGHDRTAETVEEIVRRSERRLDIVQATPFTQPPERWNDLEVEALARGVGVRVLFTPEAAATPGRVDGLREAGATVRVSEALPLKLVLRDGVEAMVALRDPRHFEHGVTSVAIRHAELVSPVQLLFQREWRRARPLAASEGEDGDGRG